MNKKPTVFLVNDDSDDRASIADFCQSMGLAVEAFDSAEEFLSVHVPSRRGCVVTDLRLMGMSGIELQEHLNRMETALPVILISDCASVSIAVRALKAGAITCLEKACSEHELWLAIDDALQQNAARLEERQKREALKVALATLTDAERDVLELIAQGKLNKQVAGRLGLSLRTVEDRRRRVMKKLNSQSFADLMRIVVMAEDLAAAN